LARGFLVLVPDVCSLLESFLQLANLVLERLVLLDSQAEFLLQGSDLVLVLLDDWMLEL